MSILKRHLLDHVPISQVCEEAGMHPNLFYRWQKQLFENGAAVFDTRRAQADPNARRVESLERRLQVTNEVLAELMEAHVALRNGLGEL